MRVESSGQVLQLRRCFGHRAPRLLLVAASLGAGALPAGDWQGAVPDYAWSFPRDHLAHRDHRIEWWYLTGHLTAAGDPAQEFGYQLTLFRIGLAPAVLPLDSAWSTGHLLMGHLALTDKRAREHRFSDLLYRETPLLAGFGDPPGPSIAWSRAPVGSEGRWDLRWNGAAFDLTAADAGAGFGFALSTRPAKPLVFQGPRRLQPQGRRAEGGEPLSFTRLLTEGTVTVGERTWQVAGSSWMDHEFSTSHLGEHQVGWDWFALQLADGRELMLYVMRRANGGTDYASATLVLPAGGARHLARAEWSVRDPRHAGAARKRHTYPAGWVVELPGEALVLAVEPESTTRRIAAVTRPDCSTGRALSPCVGADGMRIGRGYVELTGYGDRRPPI